jgi:hypothetical protein
MPKRCLILLSTSSARRWRERDDNLSFLLGGFNDLVPFVLRRLAGLGLRNSVAKIEPVRRKREETTVSCVTRRGLYSPKSFRATAAPGSLTL